MSFYSLTWNIEGLRRNVHSLKHFVDKYKPSLVFLSEPQIFLCDTSLLLQTFQGCYSYHLSSEDLYLPELALEHSKAKGGTMILWQATLDPYITVIPSDSPSIAAILMKVPGISSSVHVAIYLPTAGQEAQFVSALASLDHCLEELLVSDEDLQVFIRGDANVNPKNQSRSALLSHFITKFSLLKVQFSHPTYHHFLGNGVFDSQLDILLHSTSTYCSEEVIEIVCKFKNPLIQSHHDLIVSKFSLAPTTPRTPPTLPVAPRVDNDRVKIIWSTEGISQYQEMIGNNLTRLRNTWSNSSSPASMSVLLQSTYYLLSSAAKVTNKYVPLSVPARPKPRHHPSIQKLQKTLLSKHKNLLRARSEPEPDTEAITKLNDEYSQLKGTYVKAIRKEQRNDSYKRDSQLQTILGSNPSTAFSILKGLKSSSSTKISRLQVGDTAFEDNSVPDGFFSSLSSLKAPDMTPIHSTHHYRGVLTMNTLKICMSGSPIPEISPKTSTEILISLKADINDYFYLPHLSQGLGYLCWTTLCQGLV